LTYTRKQLAVAHFGRGFNSPQVHPGLGVDRILGGPVPVSTDAATAGLVRVHLVTWLNWSQILNAKTKLAKVIEFVTRPVTVMPQALAA
jgi:hypothetical protein